MSSSFAVTEIIDPRWGNIGTSIGTGSQVSTCFNIALNKEGLSRDRSYAVSVCRCAGGKAAQCKQALAGPTWAADSLAGC